MPISSFCFCNKYRFFFKALNDLEDACFSSDLDPFYRDRIKDFKEAYAKLDNSYTTKVKKKQAIYIYL